jgi:hypothetical protein
MLGGASGHYAPPLIRWMARGEARKRGTAVPGSWRRPSLASPQLSDAARHALGLDAAPSLNGLRQAHKAKLAAHRARNGF